MSVEWTGKIALIFFALCTQLMGRILTDFARSLHYQKRGAAAPHVPFYEALLVASQSGTNLVALDDALKRFALVDLRKSRVVELRFFGFLDTKETAEVLKVSNRTVMRDWRLAKVRLLQELSGGKHHGA
jgi:RNA polymerase sigma-70 factor, ECF subfamily